MDNRINTIAILLSILMSILFLLIAVKPKKILTIFRIFTLSSGKAKNLKEAYSAAEKNIENEDIGCVLVFMVIFGLVGFSIAACNLSNLI